MPPSTPPAKGRPGPARPAVQAVPASTAESTLEAVRQGLGLPVGTPAEDVRARLLEAIRAEEARDAEHDRTVAAAGAAGVDCPPPRRWSPAKRVLDWAQATRRIAAADRPHWEAQWRRDAEGTEALVRTLARPATIAAAAPAFPSSAGSGGGGLQTASGLDVSSLPQSLRAAAAREPDRGKVYRWVESYGGDADVDPALLHALGDGDLAASAAQDARELHALEQAVWTAEVEAAAEAHHRKMADEHQARHWAPKRAGDQ